eukprot:CAMPEP_0197689974 /NCGR_PEP_ID=MMETSP1338-20131121/107659_1 /TAXON_ID=43686 ORGANISM="Pelagodinium beii, Strain RCC1491" /NCGR_SAMPLE_ID=MMETSP1338 /ASSEMBLY_ACC=CAM_ASM_000754 /LENGTH=433 /DNA_ID=CAMNT_0043272369 /DNA_START=135 /DNA_END=1436 /DNA_ORIENTATION=+
MTRLSDDVPAASAPKQIVDGIERPGSNSSSRKQGGVLRLDDEFRMGSSSSMGIIARDGSPTAAASSSGSRNGSKGSRPGSAGGSAKGSMVRLPDEPSLAAGASEERGESKMSKMRERLNKNLTIAAPAKKPAENSIEDTRKVFRSLAEGESIQDSYNFEDEIYSGGNKGRVLVAKRVADGREVVVKIRAKQSNRTSERTWRTIMDQMHKLVTSDHVLGISEIVEGEDEFYVVMPKCNGGELFEFLANETEVPEAECKRIIKEILTAVGHLHKNGIIHRDIKPENIMFDVDLMIEASPKTVKLIDFDTCQEWSPQTPKTKRFVGTPGYIAPEALLGQLSPQSDLWSVGVILYILMTGEMPWSSMVSLEDGVVGSPSAVEMYKALKAEVLEWEQEPWPDFPLARDLCQKLLAFELEERIKDVWEALAHEWLQDAA